MAAPDVPGPRAARWRLAGIGLLALGVAAALYVAGRLHQPDYTFSMFGADPFPPKSLLATIALALAGVQAIPLAQRALRPDNAQARPASTGRPAAAAGPWPRGPMPMRPKRRKHGHQRANPQWTHSWSMSTVK